VVELARDVALERSERFAFGVAFWEDELGEHLPEVIERDGVVGLHVDIDSDCDHRVLLIVDAVGDVETAGQSCVE
jgi:hypothetical protein